MWLLGIGAGMVGSCTVQLFLMLLQCTQCYSTARMFTVLRIVKYEKSLRGEDKLSF